MSLPPRIILHSPLADPLKLEAFVEECLRDEVRLIAIWGEGAEALEEEIDWLVVGDTGQEDRFLVTSSHPDESLDYVLEYASGWQCDRDGHIEGHIEVRL